MNKAYLINGHHSSDASTGRLNRTLIERASARLTGKQYDIRTMDISPGWNVEQEIVNHQWADVVVVQTPVHWMGVPWRFKQYMDEVYSAGMSGQLAHSDGRSRNSGAGHYGSGGALTGKKYMLSLTFNAPRHAFNDPQQYLFQGKGVDDLFFPMHMNFRFFDMRPIETFVCHDVVKNPDIENDFRRFDAHIDQHF